MNTLDFLSNVLRDYCTLHDLDYISADDLLYESDTQELDCFLIYTLPKLHHRYFQESFHFVSNSLL